MSELYVSKLTDVLREALVRYADKDDKQSSNGLPKTSAVKILISTPDDETRFPVYRVLRGEEFLRKKDGTYSKFPGLEDFWTLLEIMDDLADWVGYESIANENLPKVFERLSAEISALQNTKVLPSDINIMVWTPQDGKDCFLTLGLYKKFDFIRDMNMSEDFFQTPKLS